MVFIHFWSQIPRPEQRGFFVCGDRLLSSIREKKLFTPELPHARIKGAHDSISKVGEAIYTLDLSIEKCIDLLNRAQPHRPGRITMMFSPDSSVLLNGHRTYEVVPIVGKMVPMQSGSWRFFKLTEKDIYTKLSDLRVGKSLPSDPQVIRLIDGLEEMLKQREVLVEFLATVRRGLPGKLAAVVALSARRYDEAIDLSGKIKLDWSLGAHLAEQKIQQIRRDRYASQKTKKETIALT